ncbi:MAG: FHA domain-containing protein [Spirochaetaceae bacterium]|nr:FHA domain-containing protein [Spirochaetaceae bacterium]
MQDTTIITSSKVGQRLEKLTDAEQVSYLMFGGSRIELVAKITIGRSSDNNIVIDNKLASRHHALIQKIKDAYFLKDENSTNGTFLNGRRIPADKYVRLNGGDKITIGNANLIIS